MTKLRRLVRWQVFLAETNSDWDCEECIKKELSAKRGCPDSDKKTVSAKSESVSKYKIFKKKKEEREGKNNAVLTLGNQVFEYCPVYEFTDGGYDDIAYLLGIVNWHLDCKQLPSYPPVLLEQSNLFYVARLIVVDELNNIRKEMEEKEKRKSKRSIDDGMSQEQRTNLVTSGKIPIRKRPKKR